MSNKLFRFRYWIGVPDCERAVDSTVIAKNSAVGRMQRCIAAAYVPSTGWRQCEKFGSEERTGLCAWHHKKINGLNLGEFIAAATEAVVNAS